MLSVPPIYLDEDGRSICGRCESDPGWKKYTRNIHYENLAVQFHFPCMYSRFGCFIKKPFDDISVHEDDCSFRSIKCPVETCLWSGITIEFIVHYYNIHPNLTIEYKPTIELNLHTKTCYIFQTDTFYFLLEFVVQELAVKVKLTSLNFLKEQGDNEFICWVRSNTPAIYHLEISEFLKLNEFVTINISEILKKAFVKSIVISIDANLSRELKRKRFDELKSLKCSACNEYMTPPILSCPNNHYSCINCVGVNFDFCRQCMERGIRFKRLRELELKTVSHIYTCNWGNCYAICNYAQIEAHEQSCCERLFDCGHCSYWNGTLDELISHGALCKSETYSWHTIEATQFEVVGETICNSDYMLIAFKEVFIVKIQINENNTIDVSASSFGPISYCDWYEYEIDLVHAENTMFPFNKTFSIKTRREGKYCIRLLESSINEFGGLKFCKLIFRVILLNEQDRCNKRARTLNRFNS